MTFKKLPSLAPLALCVFGLTPSHADVVRTAPEPLINPAVGGKWGDVYDWPLVAIHAALLPNGKVLAWDATPDDADDDPHTTDNYTTRVTLWDPVTDIHVETNNDTDTDLFCAGSAHLWDGRIVFAGGDGARAGANGPLANSNIYNPVSNTWHRTENMNAPRWYSSVAALSNGEMLTLGGRYEPSPLGEVFQFDQTWRALVSTYPIDLTIDYQWLQQTPEGSVISFGPSNLLLDIDTKGLGVFTPQTARDDIEERDYGSYAMYDVGKILVAGGAVGLTSSVIIDTATHQTTDTAPLNHGRRQGNLTILADGTVLATGGNDDGSQYYSPTAKVLTPEIWDPQTGLWTEQNIMPTDRQYHSIALLLPDGQVLSAGGGICGDCYRLGYEERNGELFAPPYLFNEDGSFAQRPQLGSLETDINYAERVVVNVIHDKPIEKAHLIKLGSVTHAQNQDQRLVPVAFTQTSSTLDIIMPASRNVAPPGHYMLFVVDSDGVPSESAMVKLGQPLLASDQLVKSTNEAGVWDTYVTSPANGRLRIELSGVSSTALYVSAQTPVRSANQTGILCTAQVSRLAAAVCEVDVPLGTQVHLSVNGTTRSNYTLVYNDSNTGVFTGGTGVEPPTSNPPQTPTVPASPEPIEPITASPPGTTPALGTGPVRTGGGSVTHLFLAVLLFLALIVPILRHTRPV